MVKKRNPAHLEFHQAVYEVALAVIPFMEKHPEYQKANIMERMIEAERILILSAALLVSVLLISFCVLMIKH